MTPNLQLTTSTGLPTTSIPTPAAQAMGIDEDSRLHQTEPPMNDAYQQVFERYKGSVEQSLKDTNTATNTNSDTLARINKVINFGDPKNANDRCAAVTLAEACARGAFNPATNQQLLGVGRSVHVLPQPLMASQSPEENQSAADTIDAKALANFHTNTMAQLFRRLSGIEYQLHLNAAKLKHRGEIALDLSLLKRASLFTAMRLLVGNLTTAFNNQLLHYIHRHVLYQMRNAALRAGETPYETLKASLIDAYGDRANSLRTVFNSKGLSPSQLEHDAACSIQVPNSKALTPTLGCRLYQLMSLPFAMLEQLGHLAKATLPNPKETGIYLKHTLKNRKMLDQIAPLSKTPVTENLFQKMAHPHRFTYGLSTKSLERQLAETEFNQSGWHQWRQHAAENQANIAQVKREKAHLKAERKAKSLEKLASHNAQTINKKLKSINTYLANLEHRQAIYEARAQRFARAYQQKAKRVLQSVAPTGFEQQYAKRGFQHTGHISAPNPYFAQSLSSESHYDRHRLMDETTQLVGLYDQIRRKAQLNTGHQPADMARINILSKRLRHLNPGQKQQLLQIKSLIKLNASLLKVRRQLPAEALEKVLKRLDGVFHEYHAAYKLPGQKDLQRSDLSKKWRSLLKKSDKKQTVDLTQATIAFSKQLNDTLKALSVLHPVPSHFQAHTMEKRLRGLFREFGILNTEGAPLQQGAALHQLWNYDKHRQEVKTVNAVDQLEKQQVFQKAYAPLNQAISDYLRLDDNAKNAMENQSIHAKLQADIEKHILNLMENTVTGDELVSVYNTTIASLERVLGDASGRHHHKGDALIAYDAMQALRQRLPEPLTLRYGASGYLDSLKNQRAQDLRHRFIALLDCLRTDTRETNLPTPIARNSPLVSKTNKASQNNPHTKEPYPLWQALQDRTLMSTEKDQIIVNTVFRAGSPHIAKLEEIVQTFNPEATQKQQQIQALSQVYREVIESLNQVGANIRFKANFGPGSFGNERSAIYNGTRLYDAILASHPLMVSTNKARQNSQTNDLEANNNMVNANIVNTNIAKPITSQALATALFQYIKQDLQHHFRRTDLDLPQLRDRFLWSRYSAATSASAQILSTLIGDCDEQGNPRTINDPQSRIAQLQQDYNRAVDMPAQMITQGVVNAAMLGSMFGSVPALIFNPLLMFTPLPVSLLNFGDWIAMSTFGAIAATPLTVIANIELKKNNQALIEQAMKNFEKIRDQQQPAQTPPVSVWQSYPKIHYTRNRMIQPLVNAYNRLRGRQPDIRQSNQTTDNASHNAQERQQNHPNYFSQDGKGFNLTPMGQAGAIIGETKRWVGQDILAGPIIGFFQLPWSISRLIYRDLLSPRLTELHLKPNGKKDNPSLQKEWQKAWLAYAEQKDARDVSKADYLKQFLPHATAESQIKDYVT